jgi:hypothetical protein
MAADPDVTRAERVAAAVVRAYAIVATPFCWLAWPFRVIDSYFGHLGQAPIRRIFNEPPLTWRDFDPRVVWREQWRRSKSPVPQPLMWPDDETSHGS